MRVPAEQEIEIGVRGLAIDLGRMRQQDRKFFSGYLRRGFFDVIDPIIVSVIDSNQMDALIASLERFGLVEQHPDPHLL